MEVKTAERYASGGAAKAPPINNLVEGFYASADRLGDDVAIRTQDGSFEQSWNELRAQVHRIAGGLAKLGISKDDTVAIMLNNRPEFVPCDLAVVALGGIPFSIYQTSSPEQIEYVCSDAESRVAIVEKMFLEQFNAARKNLPGIEHVIVVDGDGSEDGVDHTLAEVEAMDPDFDPAESVAGLGLDDLLTLIYTSGTTGPPKGVQLTHRNLIALTAGLEDLLDLPERGAKIISWLPAAHIAERGAHYYLPMMYGVQVNICPDPRKIGESLAAVRPTWFFSVPRVWEKIKAGIEATVAGLPDEQREPTQKAIAAATQKVRLEQAGEEVPEELAAGVAAADEAIFSKFRAQLGLDEAVALNTGAAPTPVEVLEFFHAIGLPVGELWGMSETCGVATSNPPDSVKLGTVGPPVPGVEIKLAEDGEVLVKADSVMPGYRNLPDKNDETFEDGWLLTGDIGELDADGYLKIVDRKKELIINAAGKNMSPANIEAKLKTSSPLIGQVCAIGDGRSYNVALIVLDPDYAPTWAKQNGLEGASAEDLVTDEKLQAEIQAGVDEANAKMARVEQIKKFKVLPADWAPGGDELTPTMKLKRKPIDEKYEKEIEALYAS